MTTERMTAGINQSKQTFFSAHIRLIKAQINAPSSDTGFKSASL